ncbi:MAG: carbohydrate kinase family protein [Chloroflexi bacterium]|nr:carbohydrate kinase family protein [Chloroflexota bacterium]
MGSHIPLAGLINIETTLRVERFPVEYAPARYPFFGVGSSVSGVGYNVAKALTTLGHPVTFLALIGRDAAGELVRGALAQAGIDGAHVRADLDATPQSVILYDSEGKRSIFVDLKDIQERAYPAEPAASALTGAGLAVLCNVNFTRPMLAQARALGVPVATDVHAIGDLDDAYNRDYMAAASVLFQSHENLPCSPGAWIERLWAHYRTPLAVVGMGADGALLGVLESRQIAHVPAVTTRPVVNTIGAGDALFSAFIHGVVRGSDPLTALRKAVVFASYKIGVAGAADGFLDAPALDRLCG